MAMIFDLLWLVFHGLLPKMKFNLYKIFTSDAMQDNAKQGFRKTSNQIFIFDYFSWYLANIFLKK